MDKLNLKTETGTILNVNSNINDGNYYDNEINDLKKLIDKINKYGNIDIDSITITINPIRFNNETLRKQIKSNNLYNIENWDVSDVTNMNNLFHQCSYFNYDIIQKQTRLLHRK
mgnify:CR=1 FL=1